MRSFAEVDAAADKLELTDTVEAQADEAAEAAKAAADLPIESVKPDEARDALANVRRTDRTRVDVRKSRLLKEGIEAAVKIGELPPRC